MRLIDVEHIPYENGFDRKNGNKHFIYGVETMQEWIKQQPTIDAVEVVRCKDCRFNSPFHRCMVHVDIVDEAPRHITTYLGGSDFCSLGKKKE